MRTGDNERRINYMWPYGFLLLKHIQAKKNSPSPYKYLLLIKRKLPPLPTLKTNIKPTLTVQRIGKEDRS